jgi:hypothetical protein
MLELKPIELSPEYRKEWNISKRENDFFCLMVDGKRANNSIYRKGGFFRDDFLNNDYVVLLKQVEDIYSDEVTRITNEKKHIANVHCIVDKNGCEKFTSPSQFDYFYLVEGSLFFTLKGKYYNIETGESYGDGISNSSVESSEYLFVKNKWDKDPSKRGVYQLNKKDGSVVFFK